LAAFAAARGANRDEPTTVKLLDGFERASQRSQRIASPA
jgi:hypothetical protein